MLPGVQQGRHTVEGRGAAGYVLYMYYYLPRPVPSPCGGLQQRVTAVHHAGRL